MQQSAPGSRAVVEAHCLGYHVRDVGDADHMVIDVVGVVEKPLELAKLLIEENVINEEDELLALWTGKEKGNPAYAYHRAVQVVGQQ